MSIEVDHRDQYEPTPQTERDGASGLAWATLLFGVSCWLLLPIVGAVAALICGFVERRKIMEGTSRADGRTLVSVGLVAATAQVILIVVVVIGAVLFGVLTGLSTVMGGG